MSYTGEERTENETSHGEVTQRLAAAGGTVLPLSWGDTGRRHVTRALGLRSSDGIYTAVIQSLSSCTQRELLKAAFLRRHLWGVPLPHWQPQGVRQGPFLKKAPGYLSDGKRDAWQTEQFMFTAFLPLVAQYNLLTHNFKMFSPNVKQLSIY